MSHREHVSDAELGFTPRMDRANKVPAGAYSVSAFVEDSAALEAQRTAEAEEVHWTTRIGLFGLSLAGVCSLLTLFVNGGAAAGFSMAGLFAGAGLFGLANRMACQTGGPAWLGPEASARLVIACFFLCLTALVAGLTG